ncbi:hypothetical protein CSOJ01_07423 [Colletotrichum sojae]|uniref:5'-3' DNA helicase ZGRF1-like N-terminal domain-containing protein n=1 Tax=Colletotrichum sojae TaxID=2175907 RepID=A0A8H6J9A3_9PEZI|nr:hypothetical protein CSOJ01_07423 [Colletotrichum sojae]
MPTTAGRMPLSKKVHGVSDLPAAAPVLEYMCLFTHDLKRKQKRWQDGRLKFHTFNKRIMVYDERGNFIGDMHWREDFDFDEGEEINLERGAVMVQVAECIGCKDQDLTELLDKRAKEIEQRQARCSSAANPSLPSPRPSPLAQQQASCQFKQRHLADVFNTPRGPPGRAVVPATSPYEERIAAAAQASGYEEDDQRPNKRRRRDVSPPSKSGYAQNLFGATLTLSSWPASAPVRSQPLILPTESSRAPNRARRPPAAARSPEPPRPLSAAVIDVTDTSRTTPNESLRTNQESCFAVKHARRMIENEAHAASAASEAQHWNARNHRTTPRAESPSEELAGVEAPSSADCLHLGNADTDSGANAKSKEKRPRESTRPTTSIPPALHQVRAGSACQPDSSPIHVDESLADSSEVSMRHSSNSNLRPSLPSSPVANFEVDVLEEPKAKLRIKAKRKRGLFMMNTRSTPKKLKCSGDTLTTGPSASSRHLANDGSSATTRVTRFRRTSHSDDGADYAIRGRDADALAEGDRLTSMTSGDGAESVHDDVECHHTKLRTRRSQQQVEAEHFRYDPVSTFSGGPRLASLGRRSVKSKEIIGGFDNRKSRPHRDNSSSIQLPSKSPTLSGDCNTGSRSREEADNAKQADTKPAPATRLINPATRGRKAAKLSDAAGAVPQSVIAATSGLIVVSSGGESMSKPTTRSSSSDAVVPNKSATELPGFSEANGCPWSKEAFDLLGCARPE